MNRNKNTHKHTTTKNTNTLYLDRQPNPNLCWNSRPVCLCYIQCKVQTSQEESPQPQQVLRSAPPQDLHHLRSAPPQEVGQIWAPQGWARVPRNEDRLTRAPSNASQLLAPGIRPVSFMPSPHTPQTPALDKFGPCKLTLPRGSRWCRETGAQTSTSQSPCIVVWKCFMALCDALQPV